MAWSTTCTRRLGRYSRNTTTHFGEGVRYALKTTFKKIRSSMRRSRSSRTGRIWSASTSASTDITWNVCTGIGLWREKLKKMNSDAILYIKCLKTKSVQRAGELFHPQNLSTFSSSTRSTLKLTTKHIEKPVGWWQESWEDTDESKSSEPKRVYLGSASKSRPEPECSATLLFHSITLKNHLLDQIEYLSITKI